MSAPSCAAADWKMRSAHDGGCVILRIILSSFGCWRVCPTTKSNASRIAVSAAASVDRRSGCGQYQVPVLGYLTGYCIGAYWCLASSTGHMKLRLYLVPVIAFVVRTDYEHVIASVPVRVFIYPVSTASRSS